MTTPATRTVGICCLLCVLAEERVDYADTATTKAHRMGGGTTAAVFFTVYGIDKSVAAMCDEHRASYRKALYMAHLELDRDLS